MAKYDLPADLVAQMEAADPRTCKLLLDLARCVDRSPASLILDALGEYELLNVYLSGFHNGAAVARATERQEGPF